MNFAILSNSIYISTLHLQTRPNASESVPSLLSTPPPSSPPPFPWSSVQIFGQVKQTIYKKNWSLVTITLTNANLVTTSFYDPFYKWSVQAFTNVAEEKWGRHKKLKDGQNLAEFTKKNGRKVAEKIFTEVLYFFEVLMRRCCFSGSIQMTMNLRNNVYTYWITRNLYVGQRPKIILSHVQLHICRFLQSSTTFLFYCLVSVNSKYSFN